MEKPIDWINDFMLKSKVNRFDLLIYTPFVYYYQKRYTVKLQDIEVLMYVLFEYKGKQYKAEKGTSIRVDKIADPEGTVLTIDSILMINNDGNVSIGSPYVAGAKLTATVGKSMRDKKIIVYKYKSKKDYHRTIGHRQHYTYITIDTITAV